MFLELLSFFFFQWLVLAILWGCGGSLSLANRLRFSRDVEVISPIPLPALLKNNRSAGGGGSGGDGTGSSDEVTLLDFEPRVDDGEWHLWKEKVKQIEIEPQQVCGKASSLTSVGKMETAGERGLMADGREVSLTKIFISSVSYWRRKWSTKWWRDRWLDSSFPRVLSVPT